MTLSEDNWITVAEAQERIAAMRARVPDNPSKLEEGFLACEGCGVATRPGVTISKARWSTPVAGMPSREVEPEELTRCGSCEALRLRAVAITEAHPRLLGRFGTVLTDYLYNAVCALVVSGRDVPEAMEGADLEAVVRHLGRTRPRWIEHLAQPGTCSPRPWAHVSIGERAGITRASAAVLADRVARSEPPRAVPHPNGLGCLMCGVGAVSVPALQVRRLGGVGDAQTLLWRATRISRSTLGGRGPDTINGHLCPPCSEAADLSPGVGRSSIERAVLAHLERTNRRADATMLRGVLAGQPYDDDRPALRGWAALDRPVANREPWAHLPQRLIPL